MSAETGAAMATVCRILGAPRSTIYARRVEREPAKRGPRSELSDGQLTELIRAILDQPLFAGEAIAR